MIESLEIDNEISEMEEINLMMLYKKYHEAIPLLKKYIKTNPENDLTKKYLQICLNCQPEFEEFEDMNDEIQYINLLISLNHFEEAEILLHEYLHQHPQNHEAINLSILCQEKKEQNTLTIIFEEKEEDLLQVNTEEYAKMLMMYGKYQEAFILLDEEMKHHEQEKLKPLYDACLEKIDNFKKLKSTQKMKKYMVNIVSRNNYGGILSFDALEVNRFKIFLSDINTEKGQKELEDFFNTKGYTKWAVLSYIEIKE